MKTGAKKEEKNGEGAGGGEEERQGQKERAKDDEKRDGRRDGRTTSTASNSYLMALSFSSTDSQGWRSSLNSRSSGKKETI